MSILVFELCFRTFIVASSRPLLVFNPSYELYAYEPDEEGITTFGRFARRPTPWQTNDCGRNSKEAYKTGPFDECHRLLLIGDSYVDGFHVPWGSHLASRLEKNDARGRTKVFALGMNTMPLSHHPATIRYGKQFKPHTVLCFVTEGDVRISLQRFRHLPRFNQIELIGDGKGMRFVELADRRSRNTRFRKLLFKNPLVRYVTLNRVYYPPIRTKGSRSEKRRAGKVLRAYDDGRPIFTGEVSEDSLQAASTFVVDAICRESAGCDLVFVVDANRSEIYEQDRSPPESLPVADRIRKAAHGKDRVYVCDLTEAFDRAFHEDGSKFNFPDDWHWNEHAHFVAAEAVRRFLIQHGLTAGVNPGEDDARQDD